MTELSAGTVLSIAFLSLLFGATLSVVMGKWRTSVMAEYFGFVSFLTLVYLCIK